MLIHKQGKNIIDFFEIVLVFSFTVFLPFRGQRSGIKCTPTEHIKKYWMKET